MTTLRQLVRPLCAIAGIALSSSGAAGAEPMPVLVEGSGSCPAPEMVNRAFSELISERGRRALPPKARVEVEDRDETFTVSVVAEGKSASRAYADVDRDCERRVRFAAVFAVTTLLPPELALAAEQPEKEPKPPSAIKPQPPKAPLPARTAELTPIVRLELGAFGEVGVHLAEPSHASSWGGEFRVALGRGAYAGTLGIAYAPQGRLTAPELDVDLARVSATAGARARLIDRPLALALDIALIGALERFKGTGLFAPAQDTAFELGFRAGLIAALRRARGVQPFAGIHAACFPGPREITAAPSGTASHTPLLWTGASLGLVLGL